MFLYVKQRDSLRILIVTFPTSLEVAEEPVLHSTITPSRLASGLISAVEFRVGPLILLTLVMKKSPHV